MRVRVLLAAAVLVVAGACSATPSGQPSGQRPSLPVAPPSVAAVAMADHRLGGGARLFSWTLPERTHAPWLLYVHGGSWYRGRGDSPTAASLAGHELPRGYQVFSVGYRLSTVASWPAQRDDVAAAVDWIRARPGVLGVDPARGIVLGESAGGHLAALEATRGRVAGAVDLAGVVDPLAALQAPFHPLRAAARLLVGCQPSACAATWQDVRAVTHLGPATPPFLIAHDLGDPVVPVTQSESFAAALRAAGRPVTLRPVKGHSHSVLTEPGVLPAIDRFADRITARG